METYFVDLHIHIGRTEKGNPVKITGSRDLTFYNIAREASDRKGIGMVGVIDCQSPVVQTEMMHYLHQGDMTELSGGGIRYHETTVILGSEIEVHDEGFGAAHLLAYLPTVSAMQDFTNWMKRHMKNVDLSSQRIYVPARVLQQEVIGRGGFLIPAHIFTPHKGLYGSCTSRMADLLDLDGVTAVELGLSSDTEMASTISELDRFPFVTNSDAHSLGKIGREYNKLRLGAANFEELILALAGEQGRGIEANFGLNPRLGKYHRTYCAQCESILDEKHSVNERCLYCGSTKIVHGVMDRIEQISDREIPLVSPLRPKYHYQVPLEFIPGLGKRKMALLIEAFGTEMNIIHHASHNDLSRTVGEETASYIVRAREGTLSVEVGGGGHYGKVTRV